MQVATSDTPLATTAPGTKRKRDESPIATKKKHLPTMEALRTAANSVLSYTTDLELMSAADCREYLASLDVAGAQKLEIPNDDWQTVKLSQKEYFIGQIFDALSQSYDENPPKLATLPVKK